MEVVADYDGVVVACYGPHAVIEGIREATDRTVRPGCCASIGPINGPRQPRTRCLHLHRGFEGCPELVDRKRPSRRLVL